MRKYSVVTVIYNPHSTGDSYAKAAALVHELKEALPMTKIRLRPTKYKGHAETLAYRTALISRHALIVSVSGDGGYNEVVNGAMRALRLGRKVSVGLVPAGNANDHFASRHRGRFVPRVTAGDEDTADLLRLRARRTTRYGHSYIGLGITPQAGEKLNETRLNLWQEARIIANVLVHLKSVKVLVDGEVRHYDSLIFSNVGRMSKVIRIAGHARADDGKMDVSHMYYRNKFKLAADLIHAAVFGLAVDERTDRFAFETLRRVPVQIDGEVMHVDAGTKVRINVVPRALRYII